MYIFLFYINYLWLVPKFLFKKRVILYFVCLIIIASVSFYIVEKGHEKIFSQIQQNPQTKELLAKLEKDNIIPKMPPKRLIFFTYFLTTLVISGLSIGLQLSGRIIQNEREKKEIEKEKLNTELSLLKNQVSPHFFFNTLNNIYSLIQINSENAQDAVLKLSKLMRYLLYESEKGEAKLSGEIEFMNNYIDLMKLRLNNKVDLVINFPDIISDISVQPLLFIAFIENAFKHGISYSEKSYIHISMVYTKDEIEFKCSNSRFIGNNENNNTSSGIGLENIKKRLNLLYPQKHEINISELPSNYDVYLKIKLT
jgi:LytS/YehU family sensor histidine kinase